MTGRIVGLAGLHSSAVHSIEVGDKGEGGEIS